MQVRRGWIVSVCLTCGSAEDEYNEHMATKVCDDAQ